MPQPNMQQMLKQVQKMQQDMMAAQEQLKDETVEASAGGGMVKVEGHRRPRGQGRSRSTPTRSTPRTSSCCRTWSLAAVNEALRSAQELAATKMGGLTGGLRPGPMGLAGLAACPAMAACRSARTARSSGWSPSWASCRASAAHGAAARVPHPARRPPRTRTRSPTRSARSRRGSACARSASTSPTGRAAAICADERRDAALICVVEEPGDVIPIERTHEFRGRYHVLGGALSPIDGVDPEDLQDRRALRARATAPTRRSARSSSPRTRRRPARRPRCTSPTALRERAPDVTVTRLASGLPVGGDLEYADEVTLGRALAGRRAV